jgi:hypothetical protein
VPLLESLRARAVESLRVLHAARAVASPAELKVEPICNALNAVRDLLLAYGDSIAPVTHLDGRATTLRVFAEKLPELVTALEIVSSRSASILKLAAEARADGQGADGHEAT